MAKKQAVKKPLVKIQYARNCINRRLQIRDGIYHCEYKGAGCHTAINCPYYNILYGKPKQDPTTK